MPAGTMTGKLEKEVYSCNLQPILHASDYQKTMVTGRK